MSFSDDYIVNPLKYSLSNSKAFLTYIIVSFFPDILAVVFVMVISIVGFLGIMDSQGLSSRMVNVLLFLIIMVIYYIIAILAALISKGYLVTVIKTTVEGDSILPKWENWGNLAFKGFSLAIFTFILWLVFILILMIIGFLSAIFSIIGYSAGIQSPNLLSFLVMVGLGISAGITFLMYYVLALSNYATKERFGAFFEIKTLSKMMSWKLLGVLITMVVIAGILFVPVIIMYFFTMAFVGNPVLFIIFIVITLLLVVVLVGISSFYLSRCLGIYYKSKLENKPEFNNIEDNVKI
ncbi:DUF4013 domain-containing protein [Methanococcus voltae]|uniref:Glycerophosphoryl diester phosphodiesterase membrane domain-containing protein n=1 Tax=Methanococcus voltae (strain ATCC BAA-1334 / A3) TaxID=456320 RepID=D7DUL0_METV3|nr:DUF4013 domain-containing protein [Methanococcus voltae]MCS3900621.1 hypothetical protein [Methanococcus voltae]